MITESKSKQTTFEVSLDNFTGPLDLLLELIEKRKLPINEISLTKVTDEFIKKAQQHHYRKKDYAEFISLAATLIFIKSNSLLPPQEREESDSQESAELQRRLSALAELKNIASNTKAAYLKNPLFRRSQSKNKHNKTVRYIFPSTLAERIEEHRFAILEHLPIFQDKTKIKKSKVRTLQEVLRDIKRKLASKIEITFNTLNLKDKHDKVLGFLAILEMKRKGEAELLQDSNGEIIISSKTNSIPYYG